MTSTDSRIVVARRAGTLFDLRRRSATLEGTIPLRAARSCEPLLVANEFGFVIVALRPIHLERGLRGVRTTLAGVTVVATTRSHVEVRFDTGLVLLEAPDHAVLALERCHNRRDRRIAIEIATCTVGSPIHLCVRLPLRLGERIELVGELATLAPYLAEPQVRIVDLAGRASVARTFAAFFDQEYFHEKRSGPTQKYKRWSRRPSDRPPAEGTGDIVVVHAAGAPPKLHAYGGTTAISLPLEVDATLGYFGQRVTVEMDHATLGARARAIESAVRDVLPGGASGRGAMLYLTTYVTSHPAGDPHAFFKPATFVEGPDEVLAVVDGPEAPGLEGMRGITEPSWFHAIPAVAEVTAPTVRLSAGAPLVRVRFTTRALAASALEWRDAVTSR